MSVFLTTSQQIIAPIVVMIGIGAILHRAFRFDMNTLNGNIGIPVNDLAFRHDPLAIC